MSLYTAVIYFEVNKINSTTLNNPNQNYDTALRTRVGEFHQSFNKNSILRYIFYSVDETELDKAWKGVCSLQLQTGHSL
jgi:hypothetical protein